MANALQTRNFTALFRIMDANRDGKIDWADYETMLKSFSKTFGLPVGSEGYVAFEKSLKDDFHNLLKNADKNADDIITTEEFVDYHDKAVSTEEGYKMAVSAFADLIIGFGDADQDGVLSANDYKTMLRAMNVDESNATEAFEKLDRNSYGKISTEELTMAIGQYMKSSNPDDPGHWLFGAPS